MVDPDKSLLIRNSRDLKSITEVVRNLLSVNGFKKQKEAAQTLLSGVSGLQGSLHSRWETLVTCLLREFEDHSQYESSIEIIKKTFALLCNHLTDPGLQDEVVGVILQRYDLVVEKNPSDPLVYSAYLKLLKQCASTSHVTGENAQKLFELCTKDIRRREASSCHAWSLVELLVERGWASRQQCMQLSSLLKEVSPLVGEVAFRTNRVAISKRILSAGECFENYTGACEILIQQGDTELALTELLGFYECSQGGRGIFFNSLVISNTLESILSNSESELLPLALRVVCKVPVQATILPLKALSCARVSDEIIAAVFEALAFQHPKPDSAILKRVVKKFQNSFTSDVLVRALISWMKISEPADLSGTLRMKTLHLAIRNLVHENPVLRRESLKLVSLLDEERIPIVNRGAKEAGPQAGLNCERCTEPVTVFEQCLIIERSISESTGLFDSPHLMLSLTALVRSKFSNSPRMPSETSLSALSYFALGLFIAKICRVWKYAGELWLALAEISSGAAWEPMRMLLKWSRDILLACSQSQEQFGSHVDSLKLHGASSADAFILHLELLKVLGASPSSVPKKEYVFLIRELFLHIDPRYFPRKKADEMARAYCEVIGELGGLGAAGQDTELERSILTRLLRDLCCPNPDVQKSVVICLCKAKALSWKEHRESLLRLVAEATFRDELTALTGKLKASPVSAQKTVIEQGSLEDVLLRICWSKCIGKSDRVKARRMASLSFIISSLHWASCIPHFVDLVIEPIQDVIVKACNASQIDQALENACSVPLPPSVQHGLLTCVNDIARQFGNAIPEGTWTYLMVVAAYILKLSALGSGSFRKGSDAGRLSIHVLAFMINSRIVSNIYIIRYALRVIRKSSFDFSSPEKTSEAPAVLYFLSALAKVQSFETSEILCDEGAWASEWAMSVMKSPTCTPHSFQLALDVAAEIARIRSHGDAHAVPERLIRLYSESLQEGLSLIQSRIADSVESGLILHLPRILQLVSDKARRRTTNISFLKGCLNVVLNLISVSTVGKSCGVSCLRCIGTLIGKVASKYPSRAEEVSVDVLPCLAKLFAVMTFKDGEANSALCSAISNFGAKDVQIICYFLTRLGALSRERVEGSDEEEHISVFLTVYRALRSSAEKGKPVHFPDYTRNELRKNGQYSDVNFNAVKEEESTFQVQCSNKALLPLLHRTLLAVRSSSSALRGSAGTALLAFGSFATSSQGSSILFDVFTALRDFFLSAATFAERRELGKALGGLLRNIPVDSSSRYRSIAALHLLSSPENEEVDFFENIVHLQQHRRARALHRLTCLLERCPQDTKQCPSQTNEDLLDYLARAFAVPLALKLSVDERPNDQTYRRQRRQEREAEVKNVQSRIIGLLRAASSRLSWSSYRALLSKILAKISSKEEDRESLKHLYKMLAAVIDSFPKLDESCELRVSRFCTSYVLPRMFNVIARTKARRNDSSKSRKRARGVRSDFSRTEEDVQFNAPVALAIARLCKRLPADDAVSKYCQLIALVIDALHSYDSKTHKSAKTAFGRITLLAGPKHAHIFLEQLLSFSKDAHSKYRSLCAVVELLKLAKDGSVDGVVDFSVDSCVSLISNIIVQEVLDTMKTNAEGYEDPNLTGSYAKLSGRRFLRAADCAELMGETVRSWECIDCFIIPLIKLDRGTDPKVRKKFEICLERLALGIGRNKRINPESVLVLIQYYLVSYLPTTGIRRQNSANANCTDHWMEQVSEHSKAADLLSSGRVKKQEGKTKPSPTTCMLIEFALQSLNSLLKRSIVDADGERKSLFSRLLAPLPDLLVPLLSTNRDNLTLITLKSLHLVLPTVQGGLPEPTSNAMMSTIASVLSREQDDSGFVQQKVSSSLLLKSASLRLSAAFFLEEAAGGRKALTPALDVLIEIAFGGLEHRSSEFQNAAFSFFKALVQSRIQHPRLYEVIERMCTLALQSHSVSFQSSCINLIALFVSSFPLSKKRVKQQINFFIKNLECYPYPSGRIACVLALSAFITFFPPQRISESVLTFFLPLTARSVNDDDQGVRKAALQTITKLFDTLDGRESARRIVDTIENWIVKFTSSIGKSEDLCQLLLGAVNSLTCVTSSTNMSVGSCHSSINHLLGVIDKLQEGRCALHKDTELEMFHALEKLLLRCVEGTQGTKSFDVQRASFMMENRFDSLWKYLLDRIACNNTAVRIVASRIIGPYLEILLTESESKKAAQAVDSIMIGVLPCRELVEACCSSLEMPSVNEEVAESNSRNLIKCIRFMCKKGEMTSGGELVMNKEECDLLNEKLRERWQRETWWALRRLSGIASRAGVSKSKAKLGDRKNDVGSASLRGGSALRVLIASLSALGCNNMHDCPRVFVAPVVRLTGCEGVLGKLAMELETELEKLFEDRYWKIYQELDKASKITKEGRRRKRKLEKISEPERLKAKAAAKRRRRQSKLDR